MVKALLHWKIDSTRKCQNMSVPFYMIPLLATFTIKYTNQSIGEAIQKLFPSSLQCWCPSRQIMTFGLAREHRCNLFLHSPVLYCHSGACQQMGGGHTHCFVGCEDFFCTL